VGRYDFWLDLRGVPRRRRRDLREELRGNLTAAAGLVGAREAVQSLGPLREMAAGAVDPPGPGPRWSNGWIGASVAFATCAVLELIAMLAWISAADSSGAAHVQGSLPLFPASHLEFSNQGGWSIEFQPGWLVFAVTVLAFVIGSRPWLALSRRAAARAEASSSTR
jgi:hypothetical protein